MDNIRQQVKISIVTAVYNGELYLEQAIKSVLSQDYPNIEMIIIDGGSSDGTINIIKKYDPYIAYWVSEADEGQSDALNKGIQKATGEVVAWLNSDDYFLPGAFSEFDKCYHSDPNYDFYYSNYLWVDAVGNTIKTIHPYKRYSYLLNSFYGCYIPTSGSFIKPSFFQKVGLLDKAFKYKMDTDIFERAGKANASFLKIEKVLSAFRFHGDNVSFRDKNVDCNSKLIHSKQDLESLYIKDRFLKTNLKIETRFRIYKYIWVFFRFIYLTLKYSKV